MEGREWIGKGDNKKAELEARPGPRGPKKIFIMDEVARLHRCAVGAAHLVAPDALYAVNYEIP